MTAVADWSLDPRVRKWVGGLPLPIKLPTPLQRGGHDLHDRRAVLLRLRDATDVALAELTLARGASLLVLDDRADAAHKARFEALGARFGAVGGDLPASIAAAAAQGDRRPLLLVARLEAATDGDLAADFVDGAAGTTLLGIGQAVAAAPRHSRLVAVVDEPANASAHQAMLAAATAGLLRSLHKELGPLGSTCHLLRLAGADPLAVADVAGFLLSPASAFLTALDLRLGADIGPRVEADGRVALVTGSARGIGAAIARRLASVGWRVLVNDIAPARPAAEATVQGIADVGGAAEFVAADCSSVAGAEAIAAAVRAHGRLDAVVHNAGITRDRTVRRMAGEQWRQVLAVNLYAMERVQNAVDPYLQPGAGIAMLSSVMGIAGNFGQCNYTASKAGVLALMRIWSERLAARGVRCNAIAPGFIVTEMTAQVPVFNREMAKQLTALLQPGLPEDVAELAAFLVHPVSRAVTGQTLRCDGGMAFGA